MASKREPQPWERQSGESKIRFYYFTLYRDMGPQRTLRRVAQKADKDLTLIGRYSKNHDWVERVSAWDDEQDRKRRLQQEELGKRMAERHAAIALAMMEKIVLRLQSMPIEALSAQDLANWMKIAVKIEQEALGRPSEITEQRGGEVTEIRNIINDIKILQTNSPESIDAALERWEAALEPADRRDALEPGHNGSEPAG